MTTRMFPNLRYAAVPIPLTPALRQFVNEKPLHKVVRKIKEEPLIPLGWWFLVQSTLLPSQNMDTYTSAIATHEQESASPPPPL